MAMDKNCDNCINSGRPSYEWPCTACTTAYGSAPSKWESIVAKDTNVPSWIPVSERLPEEDGSYLVTTKTGAVTTARFYVGKTYPPTYYRPTEYTSPTKWQSNRHVTHWMPLPEPPKEE